MRLHGTEYALLLGESGNKTEDCNEQYTRFELTTFLLRNSLLGISTAKERKQSVFCKDNKNTKQ